MAHRGCLAYVIGNERISESARRARHERAQDKHPHCGAVSNSIETRQPRLCSGRMPPSAGCRAEERIPHLDPVLRWHGGKGGIFSIAVRPSGLVTHDSPQPEKARSPSQPVIAPIPGASFPCCGLQAPHRDPLEGRPRRQGYRERVPPGAEDQRARGRRHQNPGAACAAA